MNDERYENIRPLKNWELMSVPPQSAAWQYAQLWHIESVLRHCVWACLRTSLGAKWQDGIPPGSREKTEGYRNKAKEDVKDNSLIPSLVWFLSPRDLVEVLACFSRVELLKGLDNVKEKLKRLWEIRNSWAHFRPVPREETRRELLAIVEFVEPHVANWTARYFNYVEGCEHVPRLWSLVRRLAENPRVLPLLTKRLPGYHGGFLDPKTDVDRGLTLLVEMNEARDVIWVEPTTIGGSNEFGLAHATEYARKLGERAIHVAVNFDPDRYVPDADRDGFFSLRISLSLKDSDDALVEALELISQVAREIGFRPRGPASTREESQPGPQLTTRYVSDRVYYDTPWNVIVAPTQAYTETYIVKRPE